MQKLRFTETVLRDAHQSLMATRMTTADMEPILKTMDQAGYHSLECWGGATFDACIRYLNEDPWERLRLIKSKVTKTPLQMLLRGQNLLGYRHYGDDVVERFVALAHENGVDIFRIFDALNDPRNLVAAVTAAKKVGAHAQLTIAYTISEVHTLSYYRELVATYVEMGADSICIKDMAGILTPAKATELVQALKETTTLPLVIHTHCTSGIAELTYQAAIRAGADVIDTAISPFSSGTSQPPTESLAIAFAEEGYETGLNLEVLEEIAEHFRPVKDHYLGNLLDPKMLTPDPRALLYQVPGGMLSNMYAQLKQANAVDRYEEVLKEVPRVRADLGFPPLVTPMSQMVGTQATMNVLTGERYKMVSNEIKSYVSGHYGKAPVPISAEIIQQLIGTEPVITDRPADHIAPEFQQLKAELGTLAKTDEDVLTYALFPQIGKEFLEKKYQPKVEKNQPIRIFAHIGGSL